MDGQVVDTNVTTGGQGLIGRAVSPTQYYYLTITAQSGGSLPYWYLKKINGTTATILASGPLNAPPQTTKYGLRLVFSGSNISAAIAYGGGTSFTVVCSGVVDSTYGFGQVGFRTFGKASAQFLSIAVSNISYLLTTATATSSDAFVNSVGINASYSSSNAATFNSTMSNLGVRHLRVSVDNIVQSTQFASELATLYNSYGITFDLLSDIVGTPAQVIAAAAMLPAGSVASVEGPNEADSSSQGIHYDPNFATDLPAYMQTLYSTVKSNPSTAQTPVIGPSLVNSSSYAAIGNISSYVDFGNMHDYMSGFNPGTSGWGGSYPFAPTLFYGSIPWNVAAASQATSPKPVIATETGYSTSPVLHGSVPPDVQAKYVPRMFLQSYLDGVPFTYIYDLADFDTTTYVGTLGIVNPSYAAKPAYTALAGMLSILTEHGTKSANVNYSWGMTGQVANVHSLMLHKANGTILIPLWIEQPSFDVNANGGLGAEIVVPQQSVSIVPPGTSTNYKIATYDPTSGAWTTQAVTPVNGLIDVNVSDTVCILEIGAT